jgi:hypothetical protein
VEIRELFLSRSRGRDLRRMYQGQIAIAALGDAISGSRCRE